MATLSFNEFLIRPFWQEDPAVIRERQMSEAAIQFLNNELPEADFVALDGVHASDVPKVFIFAKHRNSGELLTNLPLGVD